jgi:hypothetical protein
MTDWNEAPMSDVLARVKRRTGRVEKTKTKQPVSHPKQLARSGHPSTAHESAIKTFENLNESQQEVEICVRDHQDEFGGIMAGFEVDEIRSRRGGEGNGGHQRLSELCNMGRIEHVGWKRNPKSNRRQKAYRFPG